MIGCRNLPTAVAGLLTPLAAQGQKWGRCGGSVCSGQNGGGAADSMY